MKPRFKADTFWSPKETDGHSIRIAAKNLGPGDAYHVGIIVRVNDNQMPANRLQPSDSVEKEQLVHWDIESVEEGKAVEGDIIYEDVNGTPYVDKLIWGVRW